MFCCTNCFSDIEIKGIIEGNGPKKKLGNCDFCGCKKVPIYDIETDTALTELFDGLVDIYTPASELPEDFPKESTDLLKNILAAKWNIFALKPDTIYKLITAICARRYAEQPDLFDSPVGIIQSHDEKYLLENSILKEFCWGDFVEGIKHKNRFHSNYINTDILWRFLLCAGKVHKRGKAFYRARICHDTVGHKPSEMGPPPGNKAKAGRVNPVGISILYLCDSEETTFYEIRAGIYDYVTIGRFVLQHDIKVVNLADIDKISPFVGDTYGFDFTQYALNIDHLKMIAKEIAKPLRNDNVLDYLPTQYISDFIRSKGFDGIEYISTMRKKGANIAIFDESLLKCTQARVYDVSSINYEYDSIK